LDLNISKVLTPACNGCALNCRV